MGRNILVVEDDRNICDLIHMYLVKEGFDVRIAGDGGKAIEEFQKQVPDLILLDIMLPVMDGWSVCAKIRETSKVPIIMLTAKRARCSTASRAWRWGRTTYVVKPFEMKELIARINAVLRRTEIPNDTSKRLTFDKLVIDLDSYELIVDGKKIDTPPKELELLYHLASTPNRVYTRNQLLDEVWGFDYFGDSRTVDVHIKRLREKIENVSSQWALKTVWGVGYKFELAGAPGQRRADVSGDEGPGAAKAASSGPQGPLNLPEFISGRLVRWPPRPAASGKTAPVGAENGVGRGTSSSWQAPRGKGELTKPPEKTFAFSGGKPGREVS